MLIVAVLVLALMLAPALAAAQEGEDENAVAEIPAPETISSKLSLDKGQLTHGKGDTITFSGSCSPEESFTIKAVNEGRIVFEESVRCDFDGKYKTSYRTSLSDPAGKWSVELYDGETQVQRRIYTVNNTRESGFYVITFLSPTITVHYRMEDIKLSVLVMNSGTAVEDAEVVSWNAEGNRIDLEYVGNGAYFTEYEIPHNAETGDFEVLVTAANNDVRPKVGGERSISVSIEESPITINVMEPRAHTFDSGSRIPMLVEATYVYGKPLVNGKLVVGIGDDGYVMNKISDALYSFEYMLSEEERGSLNIMFLAEDGAGNLGEKKVGIVVSSSIAGLILANILYIIIAIIAIIIAVLVIFPQIRHKLLRKTLERKREKLIKSIKKLQTDYFEKHTVGKEMYREKFSKMEAELSEVEKKLDSGKKFFK